MSGAEAWRWPREHKKGQKMITPAYVTEMAIHSRWQNDSVYRICNQIGEDEQQRDRGLFFGSIHNTLDHICVVNQSILSLLDGVMP